jgi:ATP-dependent DNA helicase RecG
MNINDSDLEGLMSDQESDRVERKATASDRSRIRRTICAFANDMPDNQKPGVLFIGVSDDGSCANTPITEDLLQLLAQMKSDGSILPQPTMVVQKRTIRGCEMAVIIVHPADNPPVRYEGRVWVRVGSTLSKASAEDERRLSEKKRSHDLPFDMRPAPSATIDDLDIDFFRKSYLPSAVAEEVLEQNQRSMDQQMKSLRFLTNEGVPTYGCVLTLCTDPLRFIPGAYVQFVRFDGPSMSDPIRDRKPPISGPICDVLRRLDEIIEMNISTAIDVRQAASELRTPDYPLGAIRQVVRNAVMHRAYDTTNAPVRINWFSDRIEIMNPGGLYGQVNPNNFGHGITDYRNPLLAEAMRVLGFVQRFGMGIPIARDELEKNGNPPPSFSFEPGNFLVVIRSHS